MGVDLIGDNGRAFYFSNAGWRHLRAFAEAGGWKGGRRSADEEDTEVVSAEEARALADAIEAGMGDGEPPEVARRLSDRLTELLVVPSQSAIFSNEPVRINERGVQHWRDFIRFARATGFSISC